MSEPLVVYLHDHLAGAVAGINLIEALREQHTGEPLGSFAAELLNEVEADRAVLEALAERVGDGSSQVKNAAAWLTEKISRLKLGKDTGGELGTFEALEALSLGILGKRALWRALATQRERFSELDFEQLASRAQGQYDRVEERRLELARTALLASHH